MSPRIPLGKKFWPLSKEERKAIEKIFETEAVRCHAICSDSGDESAVVKVLDAAYWIKGCSSLGKLRYAVLLDIERGNSRQTCRCLMDIKEAVKAAAPRHHGTRMPRVNGERVVEGARHLSPYLGDRMIAAHIFDRSVFVRELLPQDMKMAINAQPLEKVKLANRGQSAENSLRFVLIVTDYLFSISSLLLLLFGNDGRSHSVKQRSSWRA